MARRWSCLQPPGAFSWPPGLRAHVLGVGATHCSLVHFCTRNTMSPSGTENAICWSPCGLEWFVSRLVLVCCRGFIWLLDEFLMMILVKKNKTKTKEHQHHVKMLQCWNNVRDVYILVAWSMKLAYVVTIPEQFFHVVPLCKSIGDILIAWALNWRISLSFRCCLAILFN